ncbi:phytanoyl-CoA dioxygenase family protein [Vibrio hangzhouensis]|uniref:phytanoyl-CoA dioxygenase family protein n=1 Tax=Vibrio hangzhouensis TaxID=462991 RepID=UPI001C97EEA7|nr:phytanoyl-CoA dioxygenase family protein [Vibrio hangzhouensis]MBY6197722.1 phytanoyl-CoA dioxygenase family protein [Vibrio hangzhouensis]
MTKISEDYARLWKNQGYFVLRSHFSQEFINRLLSICDKIFDDYLKWDPVLDEPGNPDANSVRHLLRPEFISNNSDDFYFIADILADETIITILRACFDDVPILRDTHLWCNPHLRADAGQWHRGTQFRYPEDDEERKMLDITRHQLARVHIPLLKDDNVQLIPASHTRWDNPQEYRVRKSDGMQHSRDYIDGAKRMQLNVGDVLVFDSALIHRGRYIPGKKRRTFMPTYSTKAILETYSSIQPWLNDSNYYEHVSPKARTYLDMTRKTWLDFEWAKGPSLFYWFP